MKNAAIIHEHTGQPFARRGRLPIKGDFRVIEQQLNASISILVARSENRAHSLSQRLRDFIAARRCRRDDQARSHFGISNRKVNRDIRAER